jgi:hypothetical protein
MVTLPYVCAVRAAGRPRLSARTCARTARRRGPRRCALSRPPGSRRSPRAGAEREQRAASKCVCTRACISLYCSQRCPACLGSSALFLRVSGFLGDASRGEWQRSIAAAVESGANGVVSRKHCRDPQRVNFCVGGDRRSAYPPPVHAGAAAIGLSPVSVLACIAERVACIRLVSEVSGVSSTASCFCSQVCQGTLSCKSPGNFRATASEQARLKELVGFAFELDGQWPPRALQSLLCLTSRKMRAARLRTNRKWLVAQH